MASIVYNRFKADLAQGDLDLDAAGDQINVALLTSAYTPNADHNTFSQVSGNEVVGTGYTAGGATLASQAVTQDDANDRMIFDAADVTWASSTITARYAVVYDVTNAGSLICLIDFGEDKSSDNGDFTIQWNTNGILVLS